MSLIKNITSFGKQISQEIGVGIAALGYQSLLDKAKRASDEITLVGRQVFGIAQKAEGKFQDRKDCLFWISQVTKQILINDQLLRKIKQDTVYLGTLSKMLECGNVNAAEFAVQFANELKRQQTNAERLQQELESAKRSFADTTATKQTSKITAQNQKSLKIPFGLTDREVTEIVKIINGRFPKFSGLDALGLISVRLQPKAAGKPRSSFNELPSLKAQRPAEIPIIRPPDKTIDPQLIRESISRDQKFLRNEALSIQESLSKQDVPADLKLGIPKKSLTLKSDLGRSSGKILSTFEEQKNIEKSENGCTFNPESPLDLDEILPSLK